MTRPLALLVCAFCFVLPRVASAKPKVALTEIEGDTNGEVQAAVVEALEGKDFTLILGKDVTFAVNKLGDPADFTEKELGKLAAQLDADAVVLGKLDKTGPTKALKFRLYVHKQLAKGFTVSFKDAKSPKFRTLLHDKMLEKITGPAGEPETPDDATAKPVGAGEADAATAKPVAKPVAETRPADPRPIKKPDEPAAKPAAAPHKAEKQVASAQDASGGDLETRAPGRVARPHSANLIPIRLDVGASFVQHSFGFDTTMAGNPQGASLAGPGARVVVEAYPLALTDPASPLARLGVAIDYDRTFGVKVASMGENAPVTQTHYGIGLRYRHAFGTTERSPTVTFGLGFGKRTFSPDAGKLTSDAAKTNVAKTAPASDATLLDPGVAGRYPLNPRFALVGGVRGLLLTGAGDIQEAASYGSATVYGVDADLGIDIVINPRFAVRIAGEFTQVSYSFKGNGTLTNLDGDASTAEVKGLSDRSLGATATLGVLY